MFKVLLVRRWWSEPVHSITPKNPPNPARRQQKRQSRGYNLDILGHNPDKQKEQNQNPRQCHANERPTLAWLFLKHQKKQYQFADKRQYDQWVGKGILRITLFEQDEIYHFIHEGGLISAPFHIAKQEGNKYGKER